MVSLSIYQDCIFHRTAGFPPGVFSCTREKLLGLMIRWTETTDKHGSDSVVGTESVMDLHQQLFSNKATPKKPCVNVTRRHAPICSFIFLHFWIEWHHVLNAFLENLVTVLSRHSPTCLKYTISFISWQFHTSTVLPYKCFLRWLLPGPPYLTPSQLCVSFLFQHKPSSLICALHMLLGVGPSTGLWSRQRKLGLHPLKATN